MNRRFSKLTLFLALVFLLSSCSSPTPVSVEISATTPPTPTPPPPPTSTPVPTSTTAPPPVVSLFRQQARQVGQPASDQLAEWDFQAAGQVLSSPAFDRDNLYFGDMAGNFFAVDLKTGKEKWKFIAAKGVGSSPTLVDGVAYFGDAEGNLRAVDTRTGQEKWKHTIGAEIVSSPAVVDGVVYIGSYNGNLYAVDAQSGAEKGKFQTQGPIISSPVVDGEVVYFGSGDGFLYAVDRNTAKVKWMFMAESQIQSSPVISGDTIYISNLKDSFFAVDLETGQKKWQFQVPGGAVSSPAVMKDMLYFGGVDGNLYAIDARTGNLKWKHVGQEAIISSPAVVDDTVYFGSADGRFYAVDTASGQEKWKFQTQGEIWSSPAVAGDMIYFGSYDNHVYAIRRDGPQLALAPSPTSRPILPTPTMLPESASPVETGSGGMPWWNDRIFYEAFVRSFYDSNGDGNGDLKGLIQKLDYLNDGNPKTNQDLGVTGLWLMPVTESPSYHGYDVIDYKKIEQDFGTNQDFQQLISEAHQRGMVVIVDLVMNHTSSESPWFLDAVKPGSEHENWYIWSDEHPTIRSWDGANVWWKAGLRYYFGLFWSGMPDLNYRNGAVTNAMYDIIRFWLQDMGVDGFRLDAVRHLVEDGPVDANTPETHLWLQGFHRFVRSVNPQALTVGEAWDKTSEVVKYIGDQVDLAFEFDLAQAMVDSVRSGDKTPLVKAEKDALAGFPKGQYATFLSNHDQDRVMSQLGGDVPAAKLAAALLLTKPGVPFIYYGEEVGMQGSVQNHASDEQARRPMQWDSSPNGGFTTGKPWLPLDSNTGEFNFTGETKDPASLLSYYRTLIRLRQDHPALMAGDMSLVETNKDQIYSFIRHSEGETVLVIANLSDTPVTDYQLALSQGPLSGKLRVQLLLGAGQPVAPVVSAAGGFDAYKPMPSLAPKSALVILLEP
jgi:alpha-amylase